MAEVTGLVVGAIGLAGLFSACTECFELYQRGHYFGQDYHRLETKFANQWFRLLTWQQACRLVGTGSYDGRLVPNEHVAERLEATLFQLATLLRDGDLLRRKYGLRDADQLPSTSSGSWAIARRSARSNLGQSLAQFGRKMKLTQRKATIGTKVRWAIEHKEKFETLIQHVREFIDDLERLVPGSGLQERQRQMVQTVFDSTCDIQMLESIEEAGIGQFDLISDAASLRLRCIRGQFGPLGDGASSPRDVSPSRPQRETDLPAAQEDWGLDFIPEMPRIASAGETHFLELHRVRCDITTRIFLEEPKYCTRRETDSQWVLVEEPRSLHLCGKAPITDLELFLAQSTQLDFVVFHEYECMHSTVGDESLDCQPIGQSVRVISTNLFSALQELPAIASEHPALHLNSETRFPYYWFYHTRGTLDTQIPARCESEAPGLGEFLEFLRQSTAPEYARVDDLLSRGGISWKYIPYLFRVGGVVVERNSKGIEQYQAYRVEDEPRTSSASLGLRLSVYRVEKRLSDLKVRTTLTLRCEQSSSPEDEIQLSSLGVISLQYAAEIDEDSLVSRGKQLLSCFPHRLVSYAGPIVDYVDDLPSGRWMVDPPLDEELHGTRTGDYTYERVHLSPADWEKDTLLLQPTVYGFNLKTHTWHELLVTNTRDVKWDKSLFERILVPDREYLHNYMTSSALKASDGAPFSLLFHGDPGTGKTFTSQAVSELIERPLYHITPRNLGTTAKELAQAISTAMRFATAWNCVIFLKDVGCLLNTESSLAEFVRLFDVFKGIIILTFSDRGTPLAETLSSRIPISVRLPLLSESQSRTLWGNGLRQLQQKGFNVDPSLFHGSITKFSERGLSCRDVQNALSNVERLATFSPQEINKKMVERVMSYKLS